MVVYATIGLIHRPHDPTCGVTHTQQVPAGARTGRQDGDDTLVAEEPSHERFDARFVTPSGPVTASSK